MKQKVEKSSSPPFITDPDVLVFRDFTVGEMFELPFTMTNVSFGRNSFHYKGIDQEYASLFNLIFTPAGLVSPGVGVPLKLQFTPKFNTGFTTCLHFVANGVPFDVKIEAIPKTINIQFEPFDVFDLGTVTFGEEIEGTLRIRNTGALRAQWTVSLEKTTTDQKYLSLEEGEKSLNFSSKHGSIGGYASSTIKISFKPERPAQLSFLLRFKFSSPDEAFKSFTKDLPFIAVGADVPVFLDNDTIDFGVCFYNELYRGSLTARNRSTLSQRFTIESPPNAEKFIEFQPKMGFIQPHQTFQISIKLRTSQAIKQLMQPDSQTCTFPFKLLVVNQVLPVNFSISMLPSPTKLVFDPPSLDFGTFATTEIRNLDLKITSTLQVPVDFGFVRLPNGVSIQPWDGFGLLMPNETVELQVGFQSPLSKKHEFEITVCTLQGSKFIIPCTANVISNAITLSSTQIDFEATPLGEETKFPLVVTNVRSSPVDIEFETPEDFFFDPVVATIPAGSTQNVLLTFRPTPPIQNTASQTSTSEKSASTKEKGKEKAKHKEKDSKDSKDKGKKGAQPQQEQQQEQKAPAALIAPDFTFKIYDNNIACFWKSGNSSGRHHIALRAASVLPQIFVSALKIGNRPTHTEKLIDLGMKNVNYGTVALGQYLDAEITLTNASKKPAPVKYECDVGSFEVLSPPMDIPPRGSGTIKVRFTPALQYKFESILKISHLNRPNSRVTLKLSGEGAAPSIDLSAERIDFGHVMVGQTVSRAISVKNNAAFELKYLYRLNPDSNAHHINMDLTDAFGVKKPFEWLEAEKTGQTVVTFSPDHDAPEFASTLIVSAGEDGQRREIPITASAWPHVMFVIGGSGGQRQRTAFDHAALDEPFFRQNVVVDMSWPGSAAQATLQVGVSQLNDDAKKTNGEFSFDPISVPGFTVTPMKSSVEAGGVVKVTIEYAPPANSLLQVGQWVVGETGLALKCGDFNRKIPVKFRCLMNVQQAADLSQPTKRDTVNKSAKKKSRN